ncbi:MAG: hypothetical protein LBO74_11640 [Candidatus Symbiothrix sp.]|jgi:hypothetical protein|nr:hypothetical protein [Candidatus Symbiothrix sp.]
MEQLAFSGGFDHKNNSIRVNLNMYIFKEESSYIVYCPALDLSAYGDTEIQAKKAFEDIFEITFKYMLNKNTLKEDLTKHGWEQKNLMEAIENYLNRSECVPVRTKVISSSETYHIINQSGLI